MTRDFDIEGGILLVQGTYRLDLHNDFDFCELRYAIEGRTLTLRWQRSRGKWVAGATPAGISVEFRDVSEFRFKPRDAELPFTEDDCVNSFGYWTDEDWAKGVIMTGPDQAPDPRWLTAIDFMSGAMIGVQAVSAHALIQN